MSANNDNGSQSAGAGGAGTAQSGVTPSGEGTQEELQEQQQQGAQGNEGQGEAGGAAGEGTEGQTAGEGTEGQGSGGLSPDAIAAIVRSAVEGVVPKPTQQEQPLDREALKKQLNVFEPDENLLAGVLKGGQEGLAALVQIVDGISRQSVTIATLQAQRMVEELTGRLTPVERHFQEQQMNALKAEFLEKNKDLVGYEVICNAVKDQLVASGFKGTKEQVFKAVADGARKVIKGLPGVQAGNGGGSGQGGNGATPNGQQQQQRKMSTLMQGGRGSGASSGGGAKKAPPGMEVFR